MMMSSFTATKFWFLLLDAATGQPYMGTTADFVSLPPDAVVAELRDAVLSKNLNILAGVDASDLVERFEILGGIPRHVLEVTRQTPTEILEAACSDCTLDECIQAVGIYFEIAPISKTDHSLIHVDSKHPYTESSLHYASPTALNMIVHHWGAQARHEMRDLLASCEGNSLTAALCGYIFELYAIELLERGGNFTCRQLDGNANIQSGESKLNVPPSKKIVADKVLPNQTINQLYVPKSKNYAAIDAWIPGIGAFQMTVGKDHELKKGVRWDLANLGEANRLYWVIPPLYSNSFSKKKA